MSALRSALVGILRGLPDAELLRIVRAAPDEALRPLVRTALDLDAEDVEAPVQRDLKPAKVSSPPKEEAPGSRPTEGAKRGLGARVEQLLQLLRRGGQLTTRQLSSEMQVSVDRVRTIATAAGKRVRKIGGGKGQGEASWELAR